jgi:hypothetical protein
LLLVFIAANLFDDELRPEVKEALNWQVPVDAFDKENGYVLLHGMYAPIGQDPYLAGKTILEAEIARYQEFQKTHVEPTTFLDRNEKNPYADWNKDQCSNLETKDTVDFYLKKDAASTKILATSLQPLTERFNAMKNSNKFVEVHSPLITFAMPYYSPLTQAFELERMLAVREISEGRLEVGVNRLAENSQFSRLLLRNSSTLVSHMIVKSILQKDTRLLSELMGRFPEIAKHKEQIQLILAPISTPEYSLKKSMEYERQLILGTIDSIQYQMHNSDSEIANIASKILAKIFYLPNAMQNIYYDFGEFRISFASVDAFHLDKIAAQYTEKRKAILGFGNEYIYVRNPIGKMLVGESNDSQYSNYYERHHDLDGYLTLVRLQHKLISDKISKDQVAQTLPNYPNPYTLEPMRVDTQNGFIIFDGRQPSNSNFNKSSSYQIAMPQ